jgi:hypothetical protein
MCGDNHMISTKRSLSGFNTESVYICPNCGHNVTLSSGGSSGVYLGAAVIATGAIAFILGISKGFSKAEVIALIIVFALFSSPSLIEIWQRRRYPITGTRKADDQETSASGTGPTDPLQKGIVWMDGFGFVKGLLGVFAFIALWLVFWAGVGLIKDFFF